MTIEPVHLCKCHRDKQLAAVSQQDSDSALGTAKRTDLSHLQRFDCLHQGRNIPPYIVHQPKQTQHLGQSPGRAQNVHSQSCSSVLEHTSPLAPQALVMHNIFPGCTGRMNQQKHPWCHREMYLLDTGTDYCARFPMDSSDQQGTGKRKNLMSVVGKRSPLGMECIPSCPFHFDIPRQDTQLGQRSLPGI